MFKGGESRLRALEIQNLNFSGERAPGHPTPNIQCSRMILYIVSVITDVFNQFSGIEWYISVALSLT